MNGFLRQNTSSQIRTIGPFVDDTDFKTLETALSISASDIKVKKNGGTAASKNSGGATADSTTGLYHLTWNSSDTSDVGELSVVVKVAGALAYFCTYTVLEEAVYDMLYAASATGYVSDTTRASQTSVDAIGTAVDTEVAAILAAVDTEVTAIKAKTDNLPSDPADASDIAVSFTGVNAALVAIDDFLDTEVAAIKLSTDHLATAMELDGAVYRFTQNALELAPVTSSQGNGGTLRFDDIWKWSTAATPTSGQIRGNVADWNACTEIWIHEITNAGTNLAAYLAVLATDDTIRIQQETNPLVWNSYAITGTPTDMGVYVKIPVILRMGASASSPSAGVNMLVSFFRPNNTDWSLTEREQIRYRLGLDGTAATPAASAYLSSQTSVNAIDDYVDTEVAAIKAKTDQLIFTDGAVNANATIALAAGDLADISEAMLKHDWTTVSGEATYSVLNALRMLRNAWNTTGGTLSVKKEDGTTTAWSRTLSTDASADPIIGAS